MKNSPIAALALELFKDLQVSLCNRLYRDSAVDVNDDFEDGYDDGGDNHDGEDYDSFACARHSME